MERRDLLKLTMGLVAGGVMLVASAQAAPLPPAAGELKTSPAVVGAGPAVVSQDEVDHIKPVEVRWHHHGGHGHWHHHWHRHWHWHHRHWGHHRWHHHRHW